jgi:hypothetical protein
MKIVLHMLGLLALVWSGAGCATLTGPLSGISARKSAPFMINVDDKQGWGHYSFGILQEYEEDLIAVHYCTEGDNATGPFVTVDEEGNYLPGHRLGRGPSVSFDGGVTWRTARPQLPGLPSPSMSPAYLNHLRIENPAFFHSMFTYPDGRKLVFFPVVVPSSLSTSFTAVGSAIAREPSGVWTPAQDVYFDVRGPAGEPLERQLYLAPRGAVLPDGSLVTVGYTRWTGKYNRRSIGYVTLAFRSTDGGRTFHTAAIVAMQDDAPWGNDGPCEPSIALMPDGDLLCLMRTGDTRTQGKYDFGLPLLSARSSDGGQTWKLKKLSVPGVMPKLLVMQDGTVVMATGRPGNILLFSKNSGRSWPREIQLTRANILTSGYVDILEVEPGRLLVTYDQYNSPLESFWLFEPKLVNGIMGVFVDVERR